MNIQRLYLSAEEFYHRFLFDEVLNMDHPKRERLFIGQLLWAIDEIFEAQAEVERSQEYYNEIVDSIYALLVGAQIAEWRLVQPMLQDYREGEARVSKEPVTRNVVPLLKDAYTAFLDYHRFLSEKDWDSADLEARSCIQLILTVCFDLTLLLYKHTEDKQLVDDAFNFVIEKNDNKTLKTYEFNRGELKIVKKRVNNE